MRANEKMTSARMAQFKHEAERELSGDWARNGGRVVRRRRAPREVLFRPYPSADAPIDHPREVLASKRASHVLASGDSVAEIEDNWRDDPAGKREGFKGNWTGWAEFQVFCLL